MNEAMEEAALAREFNEYRWRKISRETRKRILGALKCQKGDLLGLTCRDVEVRLRKVDEFDGQAGDWLADEVLQAASAGLLDESYYS